MAFLTSKRRRNSDDRMPESEPFGILVSVRHESSGGFMSFRTEFEIELTAREIVRCAYWPQDGSDEMTRKTHVPVTAEQWDDVEETVRTLWPLFQRVKPLPPELPTHKTRILDGGDYSRWFLTRQTQDGVLTEQYIQPDDRRIRTLIELLRELAEPIGREIPRYDSPVLCGVYLCSEKAGCSYQCTAWDDTAKTYRLIAYDAPKREKRSLDKFVPVDAWDAVRDDLVHLQLELCPSGTSRDAVRCTLYYTDGKQKTVVPDRKTAQKLQERFLRLIDRFVTEL